jgi:hypothetical protein
VTGGKGEAVSDKKPVVLYTAAYDSVSAALTGAARIVKRTVDATTDEIASELQEALKS